MSHFSGKPTNRELRFFFGVLVDLGLMRLKNSRMRPEPKVIQ